MEADTLKTQSMMVESLGSALKLVSLELPPRHEHEITVEVLACSVNFADTLIVKGKYQEKPDLPFAPGMEVVGRVIAASESSDFQRNNLILSYVGFGGFSRHLNIPELHCVKIPPDSDPVVFASLPIAYGTSHLALFHRANLQANETLLVLGAAGGVGLTAVELGAKSGATVIACARGPEKLEVAKSKGAAHLIDSSNQNLRDEVLKLGGADVVYDPVGGDLFKEALRCCKPEARILPLGFASGEIPQIPANIILVKNITVCGFYWGGYRKFAPEVMNDSLSEIVTMVQNGDIEPFVSNILPLEQADDALALLSDRKALGKVVVDMRI